MTAILAFVNVDLQDLAFTSRLFPVAVLAPVFGVDAFSLSLALGAHGLDLLHHPRRQLLDAHLHSRTSTVSACLHSPLLAPAALALGANDILLQGQLAHSSIVEIL